MKQSRGFTLVELLVVLVVTALISTVVVTRFSSFNSTILLKNLAYEVAVSLREAQAYSLSVLGGSAQFDTAYGITFDLNSYPGEYKFFRYTRGASDTERPQYNGSAVDLNILTMKDGFYMVDICVQRSGAATPDCGIDRLDISFERPEFEAVFYVHENGEGWDESENASIASAQIKIVSANDWQAPWVVNVYLLGQITVTKE